jgi:hypothetical protein
MLFIWWYCDFRSWNSKSSMWGCVNITYLIWFIWVITSIHVLGIHPKFVASSCPSNSCQHVCMSMPSTKITTCSKASYLSHLPQQMKNKTFTPIFQIFTSFIVIFCSFSHTLTKNIFHCISIQLNSSEKKWDANWWRNYWKYAHEYGVGKNKLKDTNPKRHFFMSFYVGMG